ncbi:MAG: metal-dependent transcriptional regulator [Gemmatimonadetes bacterium]|nr:metal-dependent transcriptional regulator [Gemmatimonadota bacterium]
MSPSRRTRRATGRGHSGGGARHGTAAGQALTGSVEDYVKAIYELAGASGGAAATTDIADRLAIAPPSVSGMLRRLAALELLTHEPYKGVTLTAAGRRAALRMLRRHRVIETYLARQLDYPWDRVHAEAERLEHAASDELIDRMASTLGEPAVDPHGAPIPSREGTMADIPQRMLADQPVGARTRVTSVSDDDPALLRYVASLDIRPGASVTVVERGPFEGPLTVRVSGKGGTERQHVVGLAVARAVNVDAPRGPARRGG